MKKLHTQILGTDYEVQVGKRKELGIPKHLEGQCFNLQKKILVEHSMRDCDKQIEGDLRAQGIVAHEVFHAYVTESGLDISEEIEETLAVWYQQMWRKMNNTILGILDETNLLDI